MKVIVTGGAGFIGSHVCDSLAAAGHEPVALDNLSTGKRHNLKSHRLIEADLRTSNLGDIFARERPDAVCHLAAQVDVRKSVVSPTQDAEINVLGMLRLLEASVANRIKRFVFSSSGGACYGEQDVFPAPESHPMRPVSPYGASKASGETYLGCFAIEHKLPYVALRYANVYGPRQDPLGEAGVVGIFGERLLREQPCTIFGDGESTRDFVFVADVARANLLALQSNYVGPLNIGTGKETTVGQLHDRMAKLVASTAKAEHGAARPGEQRRSVIDPTLAGKILGWRPEIQLDAGLQQTLDWLRSHLNLA